MRHSVLSSLAAVSRVLLPILAGSGLNRLEITGVAEVRNGGTVDRFFMASLTLCT
jgi:hypothetical protein